MSALAGRPVGKGWLANGRSWKQYGHLQGSLRFGYVDMTAELGHYVELMHLEPGMASYLAWLEAQSNVERIEPHGA